MGNGQNLRIERKREAQLNIKENKIRRNRRKRNNDKTKLHAHFSTQIGDEIIQHSPNCKERSINP